MKQYFKDAGWTGTFYLMLYGGSAVVLVALVLAEMIQVNF